MGIEWASKNSLDYGTRRSQAVEGRLETGSWIMYLQGSMALVSVLGTIEEAQPPYLRDATF